MAENEVPALECFKDDVASLVLLRVSMGTTRVVRAGLDAIQ